MGAAAQRRNREAVARQEARQPTADPVPANIPYTEHTRALQELTKKYELKLSALSKSDEVVASLNEAQAEVKRLTEALEKDGLSTTVNIEGVSEVVALLEEANTKLGESDAENTRLAGEMAALQSLLDEAAEKPKKSKVK